MRTRPLLAAGALLLAVLLALSVRPRAATSEPAPLLLPADSAAVDAAPLAPADLWAALLADTIPAGQIRYRVCKDLTICYLAFASPEPGIVAGPPPLLAPPPLALELVDVPARPLLAEEDSASAAWWLLGAPLVLAYPIARRGGGEGGGGGGAPLPGPESPPGVPGEPRPPVEPGGPREPGEPPVRPEGPGAPPEEPGSPPDGPPPGPVVPPTTTVPEPGGMLMMTTGLAGLAIYRRRAATARR